MIPKLHLLWRESGISQANLLVIQGESPIALEKK